MMKKQCMSDRGDRGCELAGGVSVEQELCGSNGQAFKEVQGMKRVQKNQHIRQMRGVLNEQNYLGTYGYMKAKGRINLEGRSKNENDITKMRKKRTHSTWLKYGHSDVTAGQELAQSKKYSE